jgi:hypothetical protein
LHVSSCNDGNPCTQDHCDQGACSYDVPTVTGETRNLRLTDKNTVAWDAPQVSLGNSPIYDLARGLVSQLPVGGGAAEICLMSGSSQRIMPDPRVPAVGSAFWYLSRCRSSCGVGSYGYGRIGSPGIFKERVTSTCP